MEIKTLIISQKPIGIIVKSSPELFLKMDNKLKKDKKDLKK